MEFVRRFIPGSNKKNDVPWETQETLGHGQRVLYTSLSGIDLRPTIIDEFEKNGYLITPSFVFPGGRFPGRNCDLGLGIDQRLANSAEKNDYIAAAAGLKQPAKIEFPQILDFEQPIVAKDPSSDRGESVFLLPNKESLAKFLAYDSNFFGNPWYRSNDLNLASQIAIRTHNWDWEGFYQLHPSYPWRFEEYIETPSDFYTSFRILADGYGNIHYGTLLRSPVKKGGKRISSPDSFEPLKNPNSRFYLNSPSIVSNAAQGGIGIQLNGEAVLDPINRQVLIDHGINPDNPRIPESMEQKASKVGKIMKTMYPFTGVDFVDNLSLEDLFLEANNGPTLFAEGLGVSKEEIDKNKGNEYEQEYLARVLIRRIAKNAPQ